MTQEEQKKATEPKTVVSDPSPPSMDEKSDDSKAIIVYFVVIAEEPEEEKKEGSLYRDAVLVRLETEKRMSLIKAWEEAEKSKVENKAEEMAAKYRATGTAPIKLYGCF
ncbi:unnamed protein product [Arabis nemorensis]|uniref:Remorin N-terminal domain-containing protein n=1 Tax=Arabis nemorensis TaxID=586526 RepID=A0A565BSL4_9BRAS|nr:unnamed protein product [Arabis nemorensis]